MAAIIVKPVATTRKRTIVANAARRPCLDRPRRGQRERKRLDGRQVNHRVESAERFVALNMPCW
jgi:hypothetical protein